MLTKLLRPNRKRPSLDKSQILPKLKKTLGAVVAAAILAGFTPSPGLAQDDAGWVNISDSLFQSIPEFDPGKGYNSKIGTLFYRQDTRELFVVMNKGDGLWRSRDDGATWEKVDGADFRNRTYGAFSVHQSGNDPARFAIFMVGPQSGWTTDGGVTWQLFARPTQVNKHDGWSWGMLSWGGDQPFSILAKEHHSSNIWLSQNGGEQWEKLDHETRNLGLLDDGVIVLTLDDGIHRSTDNGQTWQNVSATIPHGPHPVRRATAWFWTAPEGVLVSQDNGVTWQIWGDPLENAMWGPYFGRNDAEALVISQTGFFMTTDAGKSWEQIAPYRKIEDGVTAGRFDRKHPTNSYGWDPERRILFTAALAGSAFRKNY